MKYKSVACPEPSKGLVITDKKIVVPDMALSLEEILDRFVRGEAVEVGKEPEYDDGDEDLEKIARMDLVDRAEYVEKLKKVQVDYSTQQKKKEAVALEKYMAKKAEEIAKTAKKSEEGTDEKSKVNT